MFGLLGLTPGLFALFVVFGFMVGVFFGFFGMGGSFLVTPALLILGYPAPVAIGSSMTFVFGTAVIATLKHHDTGQVDYRLGALMFVGIALGIEGGSRLVFGLEALGIAEAVVGIAYIFVLAAIGLLFTRSALNGDDEGDDEAGDGDASDERRVERRRRYPRDRPEKVQSYNIPPMMTLADGQKASLWTISGVSAGVGVISGFLGVGGGFVRMPDLLRDRHLARGRGRDEPVHRATLRGRRGVHLRACRRNRSGDRHCAVAGERARCPDRLRGDCICERGR